MAPATVRGTTSRTRSTTTGVPIRSMWWSELIMTSGRIPDRGASEYRRRALPLHRHRRPAHDRRPARANGNPAYDRLAEHRRPSVKVLQIVFLQRQVLQIPLDRIQLYHTCLLYTSSFGLPILGARDWNASSAVISIS